MVRLIAAVALALAGFAGGAGAASHKEAPDMARKDAAASAPAMPDKEPAKPAGKGTKLGDCSKQAKEKGLKGDERNKFLSECAKTAKTAEKTQGHKLGACSKEASAKGLKGDERHKFMSECAKA